MLTWGGRWCAVLQWLKILLISDQEIVFLCSFFQVLTSTKRRYVEMCGQCFPEFCLKKQKWKDLILTGMYKMFTLLMFSQQVFSVNGNIWVWLNTAVPLLFRVDLTWTYLTESWRKLWNAKRSLALDRVFWLLLFFWACLFLLASYSDVSPLLKQSKTLTAFMPLIPSQQILPEMHECTITFWKALTAWPPFSPFFERERWGRESAREEKAALSPSPTVGVKRLWNLSDLIGRKINQFESSRGKKHSCINTTGDSAEGTCVPACVHKRPVLFVLLAFSTSMAGLAFRCDFIFLAMSFFMSSFLHLNINVFFSHCWKTKGDDVPVFVCL